MDVEAAP
jgi:hypothetical protein